MIRSPDNDKLKTIRKLHDRRWRKKLDLFVAEGEDLVQAADAAGWAPEFVLLAGEDVEPDLLHDVSSLGSGTRAIGVYRHRWSKQGGSLSVYLDEVADPGNVGTVIRSAHAFGDGPVILGPGTADPFSPKAVRASMGSIFALPPAWVDEPALVRGDLVVLDPHAHTPLGDVPLSDWMTVWVGPERRGAPEGIVQDLGGTRARIPQRKGGPESLNAAMAATVALYDLANRMAAHA